MPAAVTAGPFPDVLKQPFRGPPDIRPPSGIWGTPAPRLEGINPSTHKPYLVRMDHVSPRASQKAALAAAAHETLITLYPKFQTTLDQQFDQSLLQIPDGADKTNGMDVGRAVALAILALRSADGSAATPIPFVFGTPPETTSPHHPISRSNPCSHIGPE